MRIDVHAHYWTDEYLDLMVDLGKTDTGAQRGLGAGDGEELVTRLQLMDRAGVDMQVLSAAPQMPYTENKDKAVAAARFANDQYAALVKQHPYRFRAFATTPMPHVEESIVEIGRPLDQLDMVGVAINTTVLDRALVDPEFEPIFTELDRRAAVLYLHPAGNSGCTPLIRDFNLTWMVGAPIEDTISTMQLITRGIPSRFPHMKIINSHFGGALPMLLQRVLDDQYSWEYPQTPEPPSTAARRMWYDTVGHSHIPALRCAIESFGADRLLLGTDFPYEAGELFVHSVEYISASGLPVEQANAITSTTATALLNIYTGAHVAEQETR